MHLKNQIMKEVSKEHENYRLEIKHNSQGATLQSEVYFLRDELKEKNNLIKSLVAPYTLTMEHKEHKTKKLRKI